MMVERFQSDTFRDMDSEADQPAGLDVQLEWPGEPDGGPMAPRRSAAAGAITPEAGQVDRTAAAARSPLSADVFTTFDELRDREGRLARDMQDLRRESHALEREMEELHKVTEELRHAVDGLDATVNESNERLEAQLAQLTREVQALRRRIPLQAARPPGIGPEQVEAVAAAVAESLRSSQADAVANAVSEALASEQLDAIAVAVAETLRPSQADAVASAVSEALESDQLDAIAVAVAEALRPSQADAVASAVSAALEAEQLDAIAVAVAEALRPAQAEAIADAVAEAVKSARPSAAIPAPDSGRSASPVVSRRTPQYSRALDPRQPASRGELPARSVPRSRPPVEEDDFDRDPAPRTREVRRANPPPSRPPVVQQPIDDDEYGVDAPPDEGPSEERRRPNRPLRANRPRPFRG